MIIISYSSFRRLLLYVWL